MALSLSQLSALTPFDVITVRQNAPRKDCRLSVFFRSTDFRSVFEGEGEEEEELAGWARWGKAGKSEWDW